MGVKLGVSLIAWQNDDLPELTAAFTTEGAMEDAAKIGYSGVERGPPDCPRTPEGLKAYLDPIWCSPSCVRLVFGQPHDGLACGRKGRRARSGRAVRCPRRPLPRLRRMLQHRAGRSLDAGE